VCGGLQNSVDLGQTVPSVCSVTGLTVCADGSEVRVMRVEEVLHTQEEDEEVHLASMSPAVTAADTVCYVCNVVVLTVVKAVLWHLHSGSVLCCV
jgi:hypothetical protein